MLAFDTHPGAHRACQTMDGGKNQNRSKDTTPPYASDPDNKNRCDHTQNETTVSKTAIRRHNTLLS